MEIQIILALAALGCCTGFLAGLLGIGGGMVLTPFLTLLLGYAGIPIEHIVHVAIATSMGTILFTSLSSGRAHAKRGAGLWNVVFSMAPGILVGAVVGAHFCRVCLHFCRKNVPQCQTHAFASSARTCRHVWCRYGYRRDFRAGGSWRRFYFRAFHDLVQRQDA